MLFLGSVILISLFSYVVSEPALGVYTGAAPYGPNNMKGYSEWLNNPVVYGTEFEADQEWVHIQGESWWLGPWSNWVNSAPPSQTRILIISIPMLPQSPASDSIADGAAGKFNGYFKTLAEKLVQYKLENTVLRIGWEFNGGWYRWSAKVGCDIWKQYFINIVNAMRAVPGNKFKVTWNPNIGYAAANAPDCWPGDQYVDFVGIDAYDADWGTYDWNVTKTFGEWSDNVTYSNGAGVEYNIDVWKSLSDNNLNHEPSLNSPYWTQLANTEKLTQMRIKAWNTVYAGYQGIKFYTDFANSHNKPVTLNEWGVWAQQHSGFDNDYYIQQMHDYIFNPANNVTAYSYFDVHAGDGDHKLEPPTEFTRASQKFHSLFAKP